MMATVYAAIRLRDQHRQTGRVDGPNSVVHRDPTCPYLTRADNPDGSMVAVPATITDGTATLLRPRNPIRATRDRVNVCKRCLKYEPQDHTLQLQAACRDRDDLSWMPIPGATLRQQRSNDYDAKQVCNACPVQSDCEAYAESAKMPVGIWGGSDFART